MYQVTFRLLDSYARTTSKTFISDRTAIADVQSDTTAMVTLIEAASDLVCIETKISEVTLIASAPNAGANLDVGATLHVRLDNGKLYPFKIPGVDTSLIQSDGSVLVDDEKITDLVDAFKSTGHWKLSETNRAVSIVSGELDR